MAKPASDAEAIFIIYIDGPDPGPDEVEQIMAEFTRQTRICFLGNDVTRCRGEGDLVEGYGTFLVDLYEKRGQLSPGASGRTVIRRLVVNGVPRVVAAVLEPEFNGWVRGLIPRHLERLVAAGDATTSSPSFSRLASSEAMAFASGARDGETIQFGDLQITVSLYPTTDPDRMRAMFPDGSYVQLLRDLGIMDAISEDGLGGPDIAHWLIGADGRRQIVHLGYWVFKDGGRQDVILPYDVLSAADQQHLKRFIF